MSTQSDEAKGGLDLKTATRPAEAEDMGVTGELVGIDSLPMLDRDGENMSLTMAGSYSKRYRDLQQAQTSKAVKRRTTQITGALLARQRLEVVAGCLLRWKGFYEGATELAPSIENARLVFEGFPHIMEQAEALMEDHEAFSNANSSS